MSILDKVETAEPDENYETQSGDTRGHVKFS